jgi:hypothetical protein
VDGEMFGKSTPKRSERDLFERPHEKIPTAMELENLDPTKAADKILIDLAKSNEDT